MENKETITFDEFRAWLTGLVRGKNGGLPDLKDWKAIKKMLDKVEPEKEIVTVPTIVPSVPVNPDPFPNPYPWQPYWTSPNTGDPLPELPQVWCNNENQWGGGWNDNTFKVEQLGGDYHIETSITLDLDPKTELSNALGDMISSNE